MAASRSALEETFERCSRRRRDTATIGVDELAVGPVASETPAYAGIDGEGRRVLVLETIAGEEVPPGLVLESLEARYGFQAELSLPDGRRHIRVSTITLKPTSPISERLFSIACEGVLRELGSNARDEDVRAVLDGWASLFRQVTGVAKTDVTGLIGELIAISAAPRPELWVRAWHSVPTDTIDFVFESPPLEVEVKSTSTSSRRHRVSLRQVIADHEFPRYFVSVQVDRRESGEKVRQLVDDIEARLASQTDRDRLWMVLVEQCGQRLEQYLESRYVHWTSIQSVRVYDAAAIPKPHVELPLPPGVESVSFLSDFDLAESAGTLPV